MMNHREYKKKLNEKKMKWKRHTNKEKNIVSYKAMRTENSEAGKRQS